MHCRELVEMAATIAMRGPALLGDYLIPEDGLEAYRLASQERIELWTTALAEPQTWLQRRPLLEEILVTEVLTRVWAGAACVGEHIDTLPSIALNVYDAHLTVRNLVLRLLADGHGLSRREASELDRVRRRCERWTDLLLGYLVLPTSHETLWLVPQEFAFDHERTEEFARDLAEDRENGSPLAGQVLRASLRAAFREGLSDEAPSSIWNRKIGLATLQCFASESCVFLGQLEPLWLQRLAHTADTAECLLVELLSLHDR